MPDESQGVYYARNDYVNLFVRMLIDAVDLLILLIYWIACAFLVWLLPEDSRKSVYISLFLLGAFAYLVILKHVYRTLGYLIFDASLVNMQGQKPSIISLCVRALFLFIGPMNTFFDLCWMTADKDRQAFRDKFAQHYVIRRNAQPIGTGNIRYMRVDIWNFNLLFPEVSRNANQPSPAKL